MLLFTSLVLTGMSLVPIPQTAATMANIAKTKCTANDYFKIVSGKRYTCGKSGKEYLWDKGVNLIPYPQEGRILATNGVAIGGIIQENLDAKFFVAMQHNTTDDQMPAGDYYRSKSDYPNVSRTGLVTFVSNRDRSGWRIYTTNLDGTNTKQITTATDAPHNAGGQVADDTYPMISPDGKKIAFLSQRGVYAKYPSTSGHDVFLMNSDGSGLHQLVATETDSRGDSSDIFALVWSPDSSQIAYRGNRLIKIGDLVQRKDLIGVINVDGSNERKFLIADCGGGNVLDWQQNIIMGSYGGAFQGCPQQTTAYFGISPTTGTQSFNVTADQMNNWAGNGPGAARLSPDAKKILFSSEPDASDPNGPSRFNLINIDGTGLSTYTVGGIPPRSWLYWAPGASMLPPILMVLSPSKISIKRGGTGKLTPLLFDKNGEIVSKSGWDWRWGNRIGNFKIDLAGNILTTADTALGTFDVNISNANLSASAQVTVTK